MDNFPRLEHILYPRLDKEGFPFARDCMVGQIEHLRSKYRLVQIGDINWDMEENNILMALDTISNDPIILLINSSGGVLDTAFMLYDTIRCLRSPIISLGRFVASAAVIPLAVGQRRLLMPHSKVMIHLPAGTIGGDTRDMEIAHREMNKYKDQMLAIYQECGVKKTKKEILRDIDREYWMSSQEAIDYGLADAIVTPEEYQKIFGG